jgi:hypothetical protein
VSLLTEHSEFVALSDSLLSLLAWSLYWLGELKQATALLATLKQKRDEQNDRNLSLNLAIASGDWNSLSVLVEQEWDRREKRTADELLRAGQLAQQLGSSRAKQLVQEAARVADGDPAILLGSYSAAVSGGWEDSLEVYQWLAKAAALSGSDGPVHQVTLQDLIDRQPDWQRRETHLWELLQKGDAPIFVTAHLLNRTLLDLFLFPALANPTQADPRKRGVIYTYSAARSNVDVRANTVALDPTSLLTFGVLGQLDNLLGFYNRVVIAHSTLGWLFEEKQQVQFHQPSRIADAKEIKRLLAAGDLQDFESTATADSEISQEVGDELAAMLADADAEFGTDKRQRVVVRPGPIHRIGSLMEEEADLTEHYNHLCSCADVVAALYRVGQLTEAEAQRARDFLTVREKPWPHSFEIKPNAVLYLSGPAISFMQHLRLLPMLRTAGFTAILARDEIRQADRFIQHENLTAQAAEIIERIRKSLANGIDSGKVVVAKASKGNEFIEDQRIKHHPGFAFMEMASVADALLVDDRYMNQHRNISGDFGQKPIWTSHDILTSSHFTPPERTELVTALRRSCFCFVPVDLNELAQALSASLVDEGGVVENATLKTLRESLLIARMCNSLQLPKEAAWFDNCMRVLLDAIRLQWQHDADIASAPARSNWLLDVFDIRGWAQRTNLTPQLLISEVRYRALVLSLSLAQGIPRSQRTSYWEWLEDAVLRPIKDGDVEQYQALTTEIRSHIINTITNNPEDA